MRRPADRYFETEVLSSFNLLAETRASVGTQRTTSIRASHTDPHVDRRDPHGFGGSYTMKKKALSTYSGKHRICLAKRNHGNERRKAERYVADDDPGTPQPPPWP